MLPVEHRLLEFQDDIGRQAGLALDRQESMIDSAKNKFCAFDVIYPPALFRFHTCDRRAWRMVRNTLDGNGVSFGLANYAAKSPI